MQIPFAVNALGAAHTVPGIANGVLHLDAPTLAGMWQCNITRWDDPAIAALNPELTLPPVAIKQVARADRATATWLLTAFLDASQVGWALGVSKAVAWPPCVHRVKGVQEVLDYLNSTEYAAGMVQYVLAENQQTPYATILNKAGKWILPSQADFQNAASVTQFPSSTLSGDWIKVILGNSMDDHAYPLSGLEFIIVNQNSKPMGFPEGRLLRDLSFNMLTPGFQDILRKYRYAQIPLALRSLYSESNLMMVAANDNDTGLDANGNPLPVGGVPATASAGTSAFKWWMGLIIALVVATALLAVGAFLFLSHRRRKQRAAAQVKDDTAGHAGNGLLNGSQSLQNGTGSSGRTQKGTVGSLESAELISDQADKKDDTPSTQELVLSGPNSVNSGSGSSQSLPRAPSRGTHGTGTPGTATRSAGKENSLMGIQDLLRHRSEVGLEALELGPLVGRGSFGRVYKGRWRAGTVAVKIINHDKHVGNNFDALRESVLCSNIQHPNVVMTYKVHTVTRGQTEAVHNSVGLAHYSSASGSNSPAVVLTLPSADGERVLSDQLLETWMLLEFCDQGNLESAAREARFKNDFASIYLCLMDIASGMDYLHSLGVLHGDVKGANVLLKTTAPTAYDPRGFVCKMADFGLSRVLESDATHVSTFTYGTAAYMAPELLQKGKMTRAADVYSFSMIMVELFTCKRLFEGLAQQQIMYQVFSGQKPPLNREGMPKAYEELIEECWHDDPDARPTFAAILLRLREMYSQERQRLFSLSQANGAVAS
ncbi:hypothetical protein WJX75_008980 [Coccomyxa subellipsoidea]|uniref:Protein kinase domain-containing protein n=1 Tax=Coccomyxa subellipsoidea TaxID=248742 RepID=A0ABR2YZ02_9CHLO